MAKRDFSELAAELGEEVGKLKHPLLVFALTCCEAAVKGHITSDDAADLLENFQIGRRKGEGLPRVISEPPTSIQSAKLRTFIKLGEQFKDEGAQMIRDLPPLAIQLGVRTQLYDLAIKVARVALEKGRTLSEREMKALIKDERGEDK